MARPLFAGSVFALLMAAGCDAPRTEVASASASSSAPAEVLFDTRYPLVERVELEQNDQHFIGSIMDLSVFEDKLIIVDGIEGNVKLFAADGTLHRIIGHPGDGPGELRTPAAALELDGSILVRDNRHHRITAFSPDGEVRTEWRFDLIGARHMFATRDGNLVLAGRPGPSFGPELLVSPVPYHSYSPSGEYRYSFGPSTAGYEGIQRAVESEHVIGVGPYIVTASRSSDTVQVWLPDSTAPAREFIVGGGIYEPPDWPTERVAEPEEWVRAQMWLHSMLALSDSTFMAVFVGPADDASSDVEWSYVEAGVDGKVVSVARGAREAPAHARGDTLWTVLLNEDGSVLLNARSLHARRE